MSRGKKVALGIGIAFVIFMVLGAIGSYTNPNTNSSPNSIPIGDKNNPARLGTAVSVGDISYTVHTVSTTTSVGNDLFNEKAQGVFIIVNMTIVNNGKESRQILDSYFKLVDSQGRQFDSDNKAWIYLKDNLFLKQLQPGLATKGEAIFDVPTTPESYSLKISGLLSSLNEKYISLGKYP